MCVYMCVQYVCVCMYVCVFVYVCVYVYDGISYFGQLSEEIGLLAVANHRKGWVGPRGFRCSRTDWMLPTSSVTPIIKTASLNSSTFSIDMIKPSL